MYSIGRNNKITLTKGDSFYSVINVVTSIGRQPYEPEEGDEIRFAMKKNYDDAECLIEKDIDTEDLILHLAPADTKTLDVGEYVYDIQLTTAGGDVDTFIAMAKLVLTEEVD